MRIVLRGVFPHEGCIRVITPSYMVMGDKIVCFETGNEYYANHSQEYIVTFFSEVYFDGKAFRTRIWKTETEIYVQLMMAISPYQYGVVASVCASDFSALKNPCDNMCFALMHDDIVYATTGTVLIVLQIITEPVKIPVHSEMIAVGRVAHIGSYAQRATTNEFCPVLECG